MKKIMLHIFCIKQNVTLYYKKIHPLLKWVQGLGKYNYWKVAMTFISFPSLVNITSLLSLGLILLRQSI